MLALWHGGLALFGGLIAGLGVGLIVAHRRGVMVFRLLDACAPSIAIAIAIGRVGDLLLLDHLGKPTASIFALAYRVPLGAQLAPGFGPSPAIRPPTGASCADIGQFYAGWHLPPERGLRLGRQPGAVRHARRVTTTAVLARRRCLQRVGPLVRRTAAHAGFHPRR